MPYFQSDNLDLHYFDSKKDTLPFIGLHGLGGNLEQALDRFRNTGDFRFLSLDFRGHGQSVCPNEAALFSMKNYTNDVLALRKKLGIETFIVGGISLGAAISLKVALRVPNQVKALILVRPAWLNEARPTHLRPFETIGQLLAEYDSGMALQQWHQTAAYQNIKAISPGCAVSHDGQLTRSQAKDTWKLLAALVNDAPFQQEDELQKLSMPTLVIGNAEDPIHPLGLAKDLAKMLPNVTFQQVSPRYQKPEQYQEELQKAISTFLASCF